jgi:carbamoyl-phosphate synthase small subunit
VRSDATRLGPATLALADGRVFHGVGFGARTTRVGEVVFNTAMTGYQEILTDPSYAGQIVCLTVAEVGNTGVNDEDAESLHAGAEGLVIRALSPVVSSWRATSSLPEYLAERGLPGIQGLDTRALTRHLRTEGAVMGALSTEALPVDALLERARSAPGMAGRGLAHEVSTKARYEWNEGLWGEPPPPPPTMRVVAYDFGIKLNILRHLRQRGIAVVVVPSTTSVDEVLALEPDGVFLSNGPGDPAALTDVIARIEALVARAPKLPVFGICLGHQLLCLALGGKTFKLKFGHHGGNHPVRREADASVEITSQNHGFAVDAESLGQHVDVSHLNLFDRTVAGLELRDRPLFGVQYHPEASPGPHDASHLFAEFVTRLQDARTQARAPV